MSESRVRSCELDLLSGSRWALIAGFCHQGNEDLGFRNITNSLIRRVTSPRLFKENRELHLFYSVDFTWLLRYLEGDLNMKLLLKMRPCLLSQIVSRRPKSWNICVLHRLLSHSINHSQNRNHVLAAMWWLVDMLLSLEQCLLALI